MGEVQDETGKLAHYEVVNFPKGAALMVVAGIMSGLLGIGSGALKVMAMDYFMHLPLKVSSATSNFMIGVTAGCGRAGLSRAWRRADLDRGAGCAGSHGRRVGREQAASACECESVTDDVRRHPGSDRARNGMARGAGNQGAR